MSYEFGVSADPLSLAGVTGKLAKFKCVRVTPSRSLEKRVRRDGVGEFIPATDGNYGEREELTIEYAPTENGAVGGGVIAVGAAAALAITNIRVETSNTGDVKVIITAHQHFKGGVAVNHEANARNITLPAFNGIGGTNFFGADLEGVEDNEVQSSRWEAKIDHIDKPDFVGDQLVGRNYGCMLEAQVDAITASTPTLANDSDWILDAFAPPQKVNVDYTQVNLTAHQSLAAPA
jgi:hypothetical protein